MMTETVQTTLETSVGTLRLVANERALVGVYFARHLRPRAVDARTVASHPVLDRARAELSEYFAGTRRVFGLPLEARGTEFQRAVWSALEEIPFGETSTYSAVARVIGRPDAVRAVGTANGRNPLSIVVPCHRVIARGGALAGYAGGEALKRWLLDHEQTTPTLRRSTPGPECRAAP